MTDREMEQDEVGRILKESYEAPVPDVPSDFAAELKTRVQRELSAPPQGSGNVWGNRWAVGTAAAIVLGVGVWLAVYPNQRDDPSGRLVSGSTATAPAVLAKTPRDPVAAVDGPDLPSPVTPVESLTADDVPRTAALIRPATGASTPAAADTIDALLLERRVIDQRAYGVAPAAPLTVGEPTDDLSALLLAGVAPGIANNSDDPAVVPLDGAVGAQGYDYLLVEPSPQSAPELPTIPDGPEPGPRTVDAVGHTPAETGADTQADGPRVDETMTVEIEAFVDGKDYLIIRGGTVQWRHEEWAAVGRHEGFNEPTIISTRKAGSRTLDRFRWLPEWCDWRGRPMLPRTVPAMSSAFAGLSPPLPAGNMHVELTALACRNPVRIEQQPAAENSYTLILEFNDTDLGATWYKLRLTITGP